MQYLEEAITQNYIMFYAVISNKLRTFVPVSISLIERTIFC